MNGGKRIGAGRKFGSKDTLTRDEIRELKPRMYQLALEILEEAEGAGKPAGVKASAFQVLAPYILRKQPQDVDVTSNGRTIYSAGEAVRRVFGGIEAVPAIVSAEMAN